MMMMMMMTMMMGPDVFLERITRRSAISQPIELKLSWMVDFTIAEVIYYVPCLFYIGIALFIGNRHFLHYTTASTKSHASETIKNPYFGILRIASDVFFDADSESIHMT